MTASAVLLFSVFLFSPAVRRYAPVIPSIRQEERMAIDITVRILLFSFLAIIVASIFNYN